MFLHTLRSIIFYHFSSFFVLRLRENLVFSSAVSVNPFHCILFPWSYFSILFVAVNIFFPLFHDHSFLSVVSFIVFISLTCLVFTAIFATASRPSRVVFPIRVFKIVSSFASLFLRTDFYPHCSECFNSLLHIFVAIFYFVLLVGHCSTIPFYNYFYFAIFYLVAFNSRSSILYHSNLLVHCLYPFLICYRFSWFCVASCSSTTHYCCFSKYEDIERTDTIVKFVSR